MPQLRLRFAVVWNPLLMASSVFWRRLQTQMRNFVYWRFCNATMMTLRWLGRKQKLISWDYLICIILQKLSYIWILDQKDCQVKNVLSNYKRQITSQHGSSWLRSEIRIGNNRKDLQNILKEDFYQTSKYFNHILVSGDEIVMLWFVIRRNWKIITSLELYFVSVIICL